MSIQARLMAAFATAAKKSDKTSTSAKIGGVLSVKLSGLPDYVVKEDGTLSVSDNALVERINGQDTDKLSVKPSKCETASGNVITASSNLTREDVIGLVRITTGEVIPNEADAEKIRLLREAAEKEAKDKADEEALAHGKAMEAEIRAELAAKEPVKTDAEPVLANAAESTVQPRRSRKPS